MRSLESLIEAIHREALGAEFPIDVPVYQRVDKDPKRPILCAGTLDAPLCVFARDLGKDEVAQGQPLIGAAGRLVREGIIAAWTDGPPPKADRRRETALGHALLTNTVPYKPPGNKAYSEAVKERFRPYLAGLLTGLWRGDYLITLGTEAFDWFARYAEPGAAAAFWRREDRYEAELPCVLVAQDDDREVRKPITLGPLPHPSPLNQRWYKQFPDLLARRLATVRARGA
jgi:uracil-DNA glycosylase